MTPFREKHLRRRIWKKCFIMTVRQRLKEKSKTLYLLGKTRALGFPAVLGSQFTVSESLLIRIIITILQKPI